MSHIPCIHMYLWLLSLIFMVKWIESMAGEWRVDGTLCLQRSTTVGELYRTSSSVWASSKQTQTQTHTHAPIIANAVLYIIT